MNEEAPAEATGWGIDASLIREALKRTPRERFERGVQLHRFALRQRAARKVVTEQPSDWEQSSSSDC